MIEKIHDTVLEKNRRVKVHEIVEIVSQLNDFTAKILHENLNMKKIS